MEGYLGKMKVLGEMASTFCRECGGFSLLRDHEAGELVCRACGYVVSSTLVDHGPEWRAFSTPVPSPGSVSMSTKAVAKGGAPSCILFFRFLS